MTVDIRYRVVLYFFKSKNLKICDFELLSPKTDSAMEEQPMGAGGNAGASRIWKEMHWKEITLYLTVKGEF